MMSIWITIMRHARQAFSAILRATFSSTVFSGRQAARTFFRKALNSLGIHLAVLPGRRAKNEVGYLGEII
jgi:hypothetical protein